MGVPLEALGEALILGGEALELGLTTVVEFFPAIISHQVNFSYTLGDKTFFANKKQESVTQAVIYLLTNVLESPIHYNDFQRGPRKLLDSVYMYLNKIQLFHS